MSDHCGTVVEAGNAVCIPGACVVPRRIKVVSQFLYPCSLSRKVIEQEQGRSSQSTKIRSQPCGRKLEVV